MRRKQPGTHEDSVGAQRDSGPVDAICHAITASNQQLLDALAMSARMQSGAFPLADTLRFHLGGLTKEDRNRAARCGVLLADAGFSDVDRWRAIARQSEGDRLSSDTREWLSSGDSVVLAHAVLMVAWYIVNTTPELAGVVLGMTDPVIAEYRSLGVGQLALVATRRPHWIRPRWAGRSDVWLDLLERCTLSDASAASYLTLRCLSANAAASVHLLASMEVRPGR
jgi:hypothetical protein